MIKACFQRLLDWGLNDAPYSPSPTFCSDTDSDCRVEVDTGAFYCSVARLLIGVDYELGLRGMEKCERRGGNCREEVGSDLHSGAVKVVSYRFKDFGRNRSELLQTRRTQSSRKTYALNAAFRCVTLHLTGTRVTFLGFIGGTFPQLSTDNDFVSRPTRVIVASDGFYLLSYCVQSADVHSPLLQLL